MMKNRYTVAPDGHYHIFFKDGQYTQIDAEDFELISQFTWRINTHGYAQGVFYDKETKKDSHFRMHRFLMGIDDTRIDVDHINGDKLDNRRSNLRVCTHRQNLLNHAKRSSNTSGYTGVSYNRGANRYEAYVWDHGKKIHLGFHKTATEAAIVRDRKAKQLYGEYARLNFA